MRRPDWIEFTLVIGCSLGCDYCPQSLLSKRYIGTKKMSLETFRTILSHCPLDRIGVDFSGYADPCLHPQFIEFFQEATNRCDVVSLYTTFEGLSKEHYDILKTIPFEFLSVHLPDEKEMVHVKWTPDYWKILHALKYDQPDCLMDRMVVQGPLHQSLSFLEPVRVQHIQPRSGNVSAELADHYAEHQFPIQCSRGVNLHQNVVLPNGEVYLCCCDYGLTACLGNLIEQTYDELDYERAKVIARQANPDKSLLCKTCEFAEKLAQPELKA